MILGVDRTHAAEKIIMLGNFQHPLVRDVAAPQNVLKKWKNFGAPLGAAEGNEKDGVVCVRHEMTPTGLEPVLPA